MPRRAAASSSSARARALDEAVAAQRGTTYAGGADPYKKPRPADGTAEESDAADDDSHEGE